MCIRDRTATRILELTGETFINYLGNYDYYLEKKEELTALYTAPTVAEPTKAAPETAGADWKAQKEEQARERKRRNEDVYKRQPPPGG